MDIECLVFIQPNDQLNELLEWVEIFFLPMQLSFFVTGCGSKLWTVRGVPISTKIVNARIYFFFSKLMKKNFTFRFLFLFNFIKFGSGIIMFCLFESFRIQRDFFLLFFFFLDFAVFKILGYSCRFLMSNITHVKSLFVFITC